MLKPTAWVLSGFIAMSAAQAAYAHGTSLKQVMIQAYQNSDALNVARARLRQVDETVAQARAELRPTLNGNVGVSAQRDWNESNSTNILGNTTRSRSKTDRFTPSVRVTGTQQLYDGGQDEKAIAAARMNVLATRQTLVSTEQDVILDAVRAFFDVRRDEKSVTLAQNNVRVLREQVRAAQDSFDVGEVTRTDVSQTQARLASAISNLERAKGNLRNSKQNFRASVGTTPKSLIAPKAPPKLPSLKAAEATAVKNHPRMVEAQFNLKAAELDLERAKLNRKATINAQIEARTSQDFNSDSINKNLSASITGNIPLYNGGRLDSARRAALANKQNAQASLQFNAVTTRRAINSAYVALQTARAAKKSVRTQIRSAQIAFDGVREEAKLGARTTLDVLDAEQELLSAQSSLISANRDEFVAAYTVLAEMGLLTVKNLKLGIKEYDPDVNYSAVNGTTKLGKRRLQLLNKLQNR